MVLSHIHHFLSPSLALSFSLTLTHIKCLRASTLKYAFPRNKQIFMRSVGVFVFFMTHSVLCYSPNSFLGVLHYRPGAKHQARPPGGLKLNVHILLVFACIFEYFFAFFPCLFCLILWLDTNDNRVHQQSLCVL